MVTLWKASSGPPTSEWRIINAHNHVAYNFLPKWTPPKVYKNRGQWQRAAEYKEFKKPYKRSQAHTLL
jgi:hypothetical protein